MDLSRQGMGSAFLQTTSASVLRQISESANMIPADRDLLASFLSEGSNYAPKSGEILGNNTPLPWFKKLANFFET